MKSRRLSYVAMATFLMSSSLCFAVPPPEAQKLYDTGLADKKSGDLNGAAEKLLKAVELDRDYLDAHWALAWVYATHGEKAQAIRHFREVLRLAPETDQCRAARAALERM